MNKEWHECKVKEQNFHKQRRTAKKTDINSDGQLNPIFQDVVPRCILRFCQAPHAQQNAQNNADSYAHQGHANGKQGAFEKKLMVLSNHTKVKVHQIFS